MRHSSHPGRWAGFYGLIVPLVLLWAGPFCGAALKAQDQVGPAPISHLPRSSSGQFIIQTVPRPGQIRSRSVSAFETNRNYMTLDAAVLPVSCERIKQALWRQLGLREPWSGRIYLGLYTAGSGEDAITLTSARFRDGWQYRLEIPDLVERLNYVQSVVEVLLLEIANRNGRERSAELPPWLAVGLSQELLSSSEIEILLPPPRPGSGGLMMASTVVSAHTKDPLADAHQVLCANSPISFQQLSWPGPEHLEGEAGQVYRYSSQLFVNRLLRLSKGQASMASMLAELPQNLNWQFAFLKAFQPQFQRPLDIEKWWALNLEHFTGRDLTQTWPPEESWGKLDAVIRSPVQVHAGSNDLPVHAEVKLQTILKDWNRAEQDQVLKAKVWDLEQLRLRLATPFVSLADQYRSTLLTYLEYRDRSFFPFRRKAARRHAGEDAIKELDQLDARLAGLRPSSAVLSLKTR